MGNKALIYKQRLCNHLDECQKHLKRLENAFQRLKQRYILPLSKDDFKEIIDDVEYLAYCDQIIYRFSKLQDCIGAKLFKSFLLYEGEDVNKPFLDLLNRLEAIDIINVDEWFEMRDLRNEIAHEYENNEEIAINIINSIYKLKNELRKILESITNLIK